MAGGLANARQNWQACEPVGVGRHGAGARNGQQDRRRPWPGLPQPASHHDSSLRGYHLTSETEVASFAALAKVWGAF